MNCRQKIEDLLNINYFDETITHQEKWASLVNLFGLDNFRRFLPEPEKLYEYFKVDYYFNNWKEFTLVNFECVGRCILHNYGRLYNITSVSKCDYVCLAKSAARLLVDEYIKDNEYLTEHYLFNKEI